MLSGKVLNSSATLNNFGEIGSLEFISGEELTIFIRIYDSQLGLRYIPPVTNITTFIVYDSNGDEVTKTGTHLSDDRSMVYFTLSETETADLLGGNIKFQLDENGDGSVIRKGVVLNALSRVIVDCE